MAATFNPAARACGAQDCTRSTSQPGHPLCRAHYQEFQQGAISPCPNHPQVYKPAQFAQCRECGIGRTASTAIAPKPAAAVKQPFQQKTADGWYQQKPETPPLEALVKAVQLVRRNMTAYEKDCANHETNTIQYLIMPMLRALGWDEGDPSQVKREFRPQGKNRYGNSMAVDIALLQNGQPRIFIEAKRLDRDYSEEYRHQTEKYAAFLKEGDTATLTNGRYWLIYQVAQNRVKHVKTMDLATGAPENAAREMLAIFGRKPEAKTPTGPAPRTSSWDQQPEADQPAPRETIVAQLKEYRQKTASQTKQPPYTILKDETIEMLAQSQPLTAEQLNRIQGIGPATLSDHGTAILDIIRSAQQQTARTR